VLLALVAGHVHCGHCWSAPGQPCTDDGHPADGIHLGRFSRARRRELITQDELAAVLAHVGPVLTSASLVQDGSQ
jgi:hypothetical protein